MPPELCRNLAALMASSPAPHWCRSAKLLDPDRMLRRSHSLPEAIFTIEGALEVVVEEEAQAERLARARRPRPDYRIFRDRPLQRELDLIYTGRTVPQWLLRAGKRSISIRPEGRLRSDSGETIVQWAIEGLGIAEAPSFLVSDAIESGRLEPLLLDYPLPEVGIHVLRPPGSYVPGKVRVLIDTLVESFGGEPVWDRCLMHAQEVPHVAGLVGREALERDD